MTAADKAKRAFEHDLSRIGNSPAVERFLNGYSNFRTKQVYAGNLVNYFEWLKTAKGVSMTPDELIKDNLKAVYSSDATDITQKRKHTDWMSEYVNSYMIQEGLSDQSRTLARVSITMFYKSNDSTLFGYFRMGERPPRAPAPALYADDIRRVLLSLSPRMRTPLVIEWQSGIEINRVLEMDWSFAFDKAPPVKVELYGRKKHRLQYSTFIGHDGLELLKQTGGRMPTTEALRRALHTAVRRTLGLKNSNIRSWHSHALRASFETEASHAGVKAEIRDYFMGHLTGIQWTYNHRDELHPEDLVAEYRKIEPYVSLNPNAAVVREELDNVRARDAELIKRVESLEKTVERVLAS
ncbi:MAG: hypothetical protein JRN61_01415 [Nitrososphaerota archaeon]|nr:hypothetical protein [Nitrososphaerota archaeon]